MPASTSRAGERRRAVIVPFVGASAGADADGAFAEVFVAAVCFVTDRARVVAGRTVLRAVARAPSNSVVVVALLARFRDADGARVGRTALAELLAGVGGTIGRNSSLMSPRASFLLRRVSWVMPRVLLGSWVERATLREPVSHHARIRHPSRQRCPRAAATSPAHHGPEILYHSSRSALEIMAHIVAPLRTSRAAPSTRDVPAWRAVTSERRPRPL